MADEEGAVLIVERGPELGRVISLQGDSPTIGRTLDADIAIDDRFISRRHARICRSVDGYAIYDLDSKNGTYLNGKRVTGGPHPLSNDDEIGLGVGRVLLRFKQWDTTITFPGPVPEKLKGEVLVDEEAREAWIGRDRLDPPLPKREFDLLAFLCRNRGKACSKDDISFKVWPDRSPGDVSDDEIMQCIRRLRRRIESDPSNPQHILNVRGYGYRLA
jgi:hypothetical protein